MKHLAFAAALALPALVAVSPQTADACAMMRVHQPVEMEPLMAKAQKAEQKGQIRQAIRLYERAMNAKGKTSERAQAAYAAARLHAKEGRSDRAMSRLNRALALNPNHLDARLAYAEGLVAESPAEALEHLAELAKRGALTDAQQRRLHVARALAAPAGADISADVAAAERLGASPAVLKTLKAKAQPAMALKL
ncbi:MAG: tetratricopeptide repeat protein [Myxococcales bacterium]|nr:tetratricopeptide repeat protein [Myxococcales bacterium]